MYFQRLMLPLFFCLFMFFLRVEAGVSLLEKAKTEMAKVETVNADFTQIKVLKNFKHQIEIKGKFAIDKRGKMAWRVLSPIRYTCIIEDSKLTQWDADTKKIFTIDSEKYPSLKILSETMRNYFTGEFNRLESGFDITEPGNESIEICPKAGTAPANFISKVRFLFSDNVDYVKNVLITELNGDTTEIIFSNTLLNEKLSAETWKADN